MSALMEELRSELDKRNVYWEDGSDTVLLSDDSIMTFERTYFSDMSRLRNEHQWYFSVISIYVTKPDGTLEYGYDKGSPYKLECWWQFKYDDPEPMSVEEIIDVYEEWNEIYGKIFI